VGFDGAAHQLGTYPALPAGQNAWSGWNGAKLDAEGHLYELSAEPRLSPDSVVRRTIQGKSEVVYKFPRQNVRVYLIYLFTGP
jgi:hypothetical protein